jgi:serine protease Do
MPVEDGREAREAVGGGTRDLAHLAEAVRKSVVEVRDGSRGAGAGVILDDAGLVLTNAHVVAGERRGPNVSVVIQNAGEFGASVVKGDGRLDLALLKLDDGPTGLRPARFGDSEALRPGELVFAVGHPGGRLGAVTAGVVGDRPRRRGGPAYIRSDVDLAPGSSGGPLLNARGEVVGINAMISSGSAISIPSGAVESWLSSSAGQTSKRRPMLGVRVLANISGTGLVVATVGSGSAAERSGVIAGDVLLAAGGRPLRELRDLHAALSRAGGSVWLDFLRGGVASVLEVDLAAHGPERAA